MAARWFGANFADGSMYCINMVIFLVLFILSNIVINFVY